MDIDLNEDEAPSEADDNSTPDEELEEGNSEDFIDVLAVFDGKGEADDGIDSTPAKSVEKQPSGMDEDSEIEEEGQGHEEQAFGMDEDEDEEDEEEDEEDEEQDEEALAIEASDDEAEESPEALASLSTFISTLDPSKKRKAPLDADVANSDAPRPRKRRLMKERNEAGAESEFSAQAVGEYCLPTLNVLHKLNTSQHRFRQTQLGRSPRTPLLIPIRKLARPEEVCKNTHVDVRPTNALCAITATDAGASGQRSCI